MSRPPPLTPERALRWRRYTASSPLYTQLTEVLASDPDLLDVLNSIENPPRHNVLLAGVQYLLMREGDDELASFYPNLTVHPSDPVGIAGPFRRFVLANRASLEELGRTRYTQTNECRRCVALLPAIWATPATTFHLIDFGTSSGLNLHLDRYRYKWAEVEWGPDSYVVLTTDMRGAEVEPRDIEILSRTGLDINPIDPSDPDERMWLEALIWPEHEDRRQRLLAALDVAQTNPAQLVAGDAFETLERTLGELPTGEPAVVINSFILNQFDPGRREHLAELLDRMRADRDVFRVSMEWLDTEAKGADLAVDVGDGLTDIGLAQPHGEWLELYARP